jgi:long-chain acyl-CoA synthetase
MAQITRVFDLLQLSIEKYQKDDMVAAKQDGVWVKYSTEKFVGLANGLSCGLIASGIKKDDKVDLNYNLRKPTRPRYAGNVDATYAEELFFRNV